ncbi:P-loop NTPase fold protein [Paraburkholderia flagellata]|uniref:P-loop NTPase fold protein n=1 Tax=Paraburkholderia flagellata TaxID=2883241 RepID=UPI001F31C1EB|nr:P-loop NTPase fold protein [Paraburkholderia flagellata]
MDFLNNLLGGRSPDPRDYEQTAAIGDVPGTQSEHTAGLLDNPLEARRRAVLDNDRTTIIGDALGTQTDAEAFARIAIDKKTIAPFAIGIFGDWGAGKSSFMERMETQIDLLKLLKGDAYTNEAVQIKFNAWHYVETNLWASLATHIFNNLEDHLRKKENGDIRAKKLFSKLATPQRLRMESIERVNEARIQLERAQASLKEVRHETEAEGGAGSRGISAGKLAGVAVDALARGMTPEQQNELLQAADDLGLPADIASVRQLMTEAQRTRTLLSRNVLVLKSIAKLRLGPRQILVWAAVVLGFMILGSWAAGELVRILDWQLAKKAANVVGGMIATALGFFTALNSIAKKTAEATAKLGEVAKRIQREIASDTAEDGAARRERVAVAERVVASAEEALLIAKQDFQRTSPHALLNEFICEKASGEDYSRYLGLVATIRRDFDQLSQIMCRSDVQTVPLDHYEKETIARYSDVLEREGLRLEESAPTGELRYFDRIILYIDDLDRCRPDKVAEVLQAIHLLLAFPLFVVVVAVDYRWVSSALRAYYRGQLATEPFTSQNNEDSGGYIRRRDIVAEPDDYIEKIFQIPYWVRPVDNLAGAALLEAYTRDDIPTEPSAPSLSKGSTQSGSGIGSGDAPLPELPPDEPVPAQPTGFGPQPKIESQGPSPRPGSARDESVASTLSGNDVPTMRIEERVVLQRSEIDFMKEVAFIAGNTPRRLKRFANSYRVIKATLWNSTPSDWLSAAQPGGPAPHYKAVLLQLAFVTGYAASFEQYAVEQAIASEEDLGILSLIERLEKGLFQGSPGATDFSRGLKLLVPEHDSSSTLVRMALYAPFVARFSFCNPNRIRTYSLEAKSR